MTDYGEVSSTDGADESLNKAIFAYLVIHRVAADDGCSHNPSTRF